MTRHRPLDQQHITRADQLLADGEWQDGLEFLIEIEKMITPSVARRRTERIRRQVSKREERVKPVSDTAQIAMGKRSITQAFVHSRVTSDAYEVDPWPIPEGGWRQGGWKIRRREREEAITLIRLAKEVHHTSVRLLRDLIAQEPALRTKTSGYKTEVYVSELAELERRVNAFRADRSDRARAAMIRRFTPDGGVAIKCLTGRELGERSGIGARAVRQLWVANPLLGWVPTAGDRVILLPEERLDDWDAVVAQYKAGTFERRSEASKLARAALRHAQSVDNIPR